MSFSAFSKDFRENAFTNVENQFITKYLPHADGDSVRAYLYGLYLCQCAEEFDADAAAKLLKIPKDRLVEIFGFWEECDLVHVLSRDPLYVEYLPVNSAVGKPKPIRPEKYAEFNRELYKLLQKAGTMFKPYEMQKILEFLEDNPMEQQAFLLVAEYCVKKDGEKLSSSHILNKAKKLCDEHKFTYEQAERDLADFNAHEKELKKIFTLLGIYRKPQDGDYDFLEKWTALGIETRAVYECAASMKKGTLATLDQLVTELCEREIFTQKDAKPYLERRAELANVVFKIAAKLGIKIQNPRAYCDEYAEKWLERGYDEESLISLASLCFKMRYDFPEMDSLIDRLYADGIVDGAGVADYCAARDKEMKLLQKIQSYCGVVKKSQSAFDMISAWRNWNFSDAMILEAAKRSANAASPLPYMNKLLSEWKRSGVFTPQAIPERVAAPSHADYKSEAVIAADLRSDRERHYSNLRRSAEERAERAKRRAEQDEEFRLAEANAKTTEIALARAEVFSPEQLPDLKARLAQYRAERAAALKRLNLSDADFSPVYTCKKCSDTGFLPDGTPCDCYRK